jgi:hypothetical protein
MNTDTQPTEPEAPKPDAPPTNQNAALKLGPKYDEAIMGATIRGEFVYSLTKLATIETTEEVSAEEAVAYIAQQVIDVTRQWGEQAPVFVDDSLFVAPVNIEIMAPDERPRILLPR